MRLPPTEVYDVVRLDDPGHSRRADELPNSTHDIGEGLMPQAASGPVGGQVLPVWLAIGAVFALVVGAGAGILAWLGGDNVPTSILKGGGAFGATFTVVILVIGLRG